MDPPTLCRVRASWPRFGRWELMWTLFGSPRHGFTGRRFTTWPIGPGGEFVSRSRYIPRGLPQWGAPFPLLWIPQLRRFSGRFGMGEKAPPVRSVNVSGTNLISAGDVASASAHSRAPVIIEMARRRALYYVMLWDARGCPSARRKVII